MACYGYTAFGLPVFSHIRLPQHIIPKATKKKSNRVPMSVFHIDDAGVLSNSHQAHKTTHGRSLNNLYGNFIKFGCVGTWGASIIKPRLTCHLSLRF